MRGDGRADAEGRKQVDERDDDAAGDDGLRDLALGVAHIVGIRAHDLEAQEVEDDDRDIRQAVQVKPRQERAEGHVVDKAVFHDVDDAEHADRQREDHFDGGADVEDEDAVAHGVKCDPRDDPDEGELDEQLCQPPELQSCEHAEQLRAHDGERGHPQRKVDPVVPRGARAPLRARERLVDPVIEPAVAGIRRAELGRDHAVRQQEGDHHEHPPEILAVADGGDGCRRLRHEHDADDREDDVRKAEFFSFFHGVCSFGSRSAAAEPRVEEGVELLLRRGKLQLRRDAAAAREIHQQAAHGRQAVAGLLPAEGGGGVGDLVGHVLAARSRQTVQELAAERAELHELAVDLVVGKDAHALFLRHLVFIQAVPDVSIDKVRAAHGVALVRDGPAAAGALAVGLQNAFVVGAQLVSLRAVVHEVHAELRGDEAERRAHLRSVADEDDLAVLQPLALGQVLLDGAQVADLLRGVVVVAHAVDDRDRARIGELNDRLVLDDAGHDHVDQAREHLARVADGLVAAELDHARAEILRVAAELAHGRLERHARAGARLLKDHAEVHIFHQRGIITPADGALDGERQVDDVQQFLFCEIVGVNKIFFVHIHSSKAAVYGICFPVIVGGFAYGYARRTNFPFSRHDRCRFFAEQKTRPQKPRLLRACRVVF